MLNNNLKIMHYDKYQIKIIIYGLIYDLIYDTILLKGSIYFGYLNRKYTYMFCFLYILNYVIIPIEKYNELKCMTFRNPDS